MSRSAQDDNGLVEAASGVTALRSPGNFGINVKVKVKVKGNGQEGPFHTGVASLR